MTEAFESDGSPMKPDLAEILPVAVVEALVARSENELRSMWHEMEETVRAAESAERRLKANRVAVVYDDAFENDVLAYMQRVLESEDGERPSLSTPGQALIPSQSGNGHSSSVDVAPPPPPPPAVPSAPVGLATDGEPTGQMHATSSSSTTPRTVVVDRSYRATESANLAQPPASPPTSPPAVDGSHSPLPAWAVSPLPDEARRGSPGSVANPAPEHTWTSRIPARLLMQVGLVLVVAALLLLKLG